MPWVKAAGAGATMGYSPASELIDPAAPAASPLPRKPLGDARGGGTKFAVGDAAYQGSRAWIEDVAAVRAGKVKSAADLPRSVPTPARFGTDFG